MKESNLLLSMTAHYSDPFHISLFEHCSHLLEIDHIISQNTGEHYFRNTIVRSKNWPANFPSIVVPLTSQHLGWTEPGGKELHYRRQTSFESALRTQWCFSNFDARLRRDGLPSELELLSVNKCSKLV